MYEILSDVPPPNQNPGAVTAVNCIVNEVNDCVFRKICENLNKFCLTIWKFLKFFESFKENVNKHFEKLNEIIIFYYYLFLLLAEAWVVPILCNCSEV